MAETRKLTHELERSGLPERTQLIIALAPGCLFGFPPDNLTEIIERVDCPTCRQMMALAKKGCEADAELQRKVDDLCHPVRERNNARREAYERRSRRFIIGRFTRLPEFEPEPDYKNEPWHAEAMKEIDRMEAELNRLSEEDVPHWGDEENRKTSCEVVGLFFVKDSYVTIP